MARLLDRLGRRICVIEQLSIAYPVGRSGSAFQALLPASVLDLLDITRCRHFVVQDDSGNRYPAVIEYAEPPGREPRVLAAIRGFVVTSGR